MTRESAIGRRFEPGLEQHVALVTQWSEWWSYDVVVLLQCRGVSAAMPMRRRICVVLRTPVFTIFSSIRRRKRVELILDNISLRLKNLATLDSSQLTLEYPDNFTTGRVLHNSVLPSFPGWQSKCSRLLIHQSEASFVEMKWKP